MRDAPDGSGVARDAQDGGEHVLLGEEEGGDPHGGVGELGERGVFVLVGGGFILGQDRQGQEIGDGLAAQRPRAGVDLRGAVVKVDEGFLDEIEAVAVRAAGEGELVPEAADHADPGHALGFDVLAGRAGFGRHAGEDAVDFDVGVVAPFVGHDVLHPCGGGGVDEVALGFGRGHDAHCDDEDFLVLERGDEGGWVIVVYFFGDDAVGDFAGAVGAGDGGDVVLAGGEEGFGDVSPYGATDLQGAWVSSNVGT